VAFDPRPQRTDHTPEILARIWIPFAPYALQYLVVRHWRTTGREQHQQQIKLPTGKLQRLTAKADSARERIDFDDAGGRGDAVRMQPNPGSQQQTSDTRRQFLHQEWFLNAVVSPAIEKLASGPQAALIE